MEIIITTILYLALGIFFVDNTTINEFYSVLGITLISISVIINAYRKYHQIFWILILGYTLRLFVIYIDYNQIVPIIHSGADTTRFFNIAYHNLFISDSSNEIVLTNYSIFLSRLFDIVGPQRIIAQYINTLAGYGTITYTYIILRNIQASRKNTSMCILLLAVFPNVVIFGGILLRESLIIYVTTISFYHFIRWFSKGSISNFALAVILSLISIILHSGMIGFTLGYLIIFSIYEPDSKSIKLSYKTIIYGLASVLIMTFLLFGTNIFTTYFGDVIDSTSNTISTEALMERLQTEKPDAGSAYLEGLKVTNPFQMVLFAPIRMLYFLFSPMPWDFRGLGNIIAFALDGLFYLVLFIIIYATKNKNPRTLDDKFTTPRYSILMLPIWATILLYSVGTSTSGTAMRHRANFFPELLVIAVATKSTTTNKEYKSIRFKDSSNNKFIQ